MGLFDFWGKKDCQYSSEIMIQIANEWTEDFIQTAPKFERAYIRDEVYMFCCWILLDYGKNYGYLNKNSNINAFFDTIFQSVKNVGNYSQTEFDHFMYRVEQYQKDVKGMLQCDYPKTPMFFTEGLFSLFTDSCYSDIHLFEEDFDIFDDEKEFHNLILFTDFIGSFWNKVNKDIMNRFPKR